MSLWDSPWWRFRDPSFHLFDTDQGCNGQTDGRTPRPWLWRAKHSAVARKNHTKHQWLCELCFLFAYRKYVVEHNLAFDVALRVCLNAHRTKLSILISNFLNCFLPLSAHARSFNFGCVAVTEISLNERRVISFVITWIVNYSAKPTTDPISSISRHHRGTAIDNNLILQWLCYLSKGLTGSIFWLTFVRESRLLIDFRSTSPCIKQ